MTREEAIKLRDDNIQFYREGILERPSYEIFEVNDVLDVIDGIIIEIEKCDKNIEALQERPKGRWIKDIGIRIDVRTGNRWEETYYNCSKCDYASDWFSPFCPACGADMKGE